MVPYANTLKLTADLQRGQDPAAGRHSRSSGPVVLPGDDLPLPDLPGPGPGPGGPVQHPVGAAQPAPSASHPVAADTVGHPGLRHPVPQRHRGGRCWPASAGAYLTIGLGRQLRQGHVVRGEGLHRTRRDDLSGGYTPFGAIGAALLFRFLHATAVDSCPPMKRADPGPTCYWRPPVRRGRSSWWRGWSARVRPPKAEGIPYGQGIDSCRNGLAYPSGRKAGRAPAGLCA